MTLDRDTLISWFAIAFIPIILWSISKAFPLTPDNLLLRVLYVIVIFCCFTFTIMLIRNTCQKSEHSKLGGWFIIVMLAMIAGTLMTIHQDEALAGIGVELIGTFITAIVIFIMDKDLSSIWRADKKLSTHEKFRQAIKKSRALRSTHGRCRVGSKKYYVIKK